MTDSLKASNSTLNAHPSSEKGTDPLIKRQILSEYQEFRMIGHLRQLLAPLVEHPDRRDALNALDPLTLVSPEDPTFMEKVTALRLLREVYQETIHNHEMAVWLEEKFAGMDPDDPRWMALKNRYDNNQKKPPTGTPPTPGTSTSRLLFLELCHECGKKDATQKAIMELIGPSLVEGVLNSPPVPPATDAARKQHADQLEQDADYRREVESTLQRIRQVAESSPRLAQAMRQSINMTRIFGLPRDSETMGSFAVMQEEVNTLLNALETGEIGRKEKGDS